MIDMDNKTLGERRVRLYFNPAEQSNIDIVKENAATVINDLQEYWKSIVEDNEHLSREVFHRKYSELKREIDIAQQYYETACMYAVKALTYQA